MLILYTKLTVSSSSVSVCSGERWAFLVLSLGSASLAMLSKELGITAIPVCLAYDLFILRKHHHSKFPVSRHAGFMRRSVIVACSGMALLYLRFTLMNGTPNFSTYVRSINDIAS